jgi:integrase
VYLKHGAYYLVRLDGGKRRWTRLATEYAEALARLSRLVESAAPSLTVDALIARYELEELPRLAPRHRRNRAADLKKIAKVFGRMPPSTITPGMVTTYWRRAGQTEGTRHRIRALSALLTFGRQIGAVDGHNPCFGLQLERARPRRRYVTDEELAIVRSCAPPMMRGAIDLAVLAGMDGATIRALERRHLTDRGVEFMRPKLARRDPELQVIEWSEDLRGTVRSLLSLRPQLRQFVVCNQQGQPYTLDGFQAQWQRVMRNAMKKGLTERFHFHDLRAKSASDAASDQEAADRLGHGDAALTRRVYRRLPRVAKPLGFEETQGAQGARATYPSSVLAARRYKAAVSQATPLWVDLTEIELVYARARAKTRQTGVLHSVDHIVPLQGDGVCGLHVHWNLRVVTATENREKGNAIPESAERVAAEIVDRRKNSRQPKIRRRVVSEK